MIDLKSLPAGVWQGRVAESVHTVRGMARESDAVKKKWSDIKSAAKKKGAERPFMWTSWRRSSIIGETVVEELRNWYVR